MFVATDADGPVGEAALEEPVRPPSRDEDVGGVGDVPRQGTCSSQPP
ncbi:hypothetical protein EE612_047359 [Oryza sativa]|nr:hypothetical protein EE612_047359 [Oryza sativa]